MKTFTDVTIYRNGKPIKVTVSRKPFNPEKFPNVEFLSVEKALDERGDRVQLIYPEERQALELVKAGLDGARQE